MAYFIDGKDCIVAEWTLLALAYAFVAMRIYTRSVCLRKRLNCSDVLLIAAAVDALGLIVCDTLTFQMNVMDDYRTSEKLSKVSFASNYFYDVGLGLPKLSILAFYWSSFNLESHRKIRNFFWSVTAFVAACYLTSLFDDTFFCGADVSVQWSQKVGACSVFYAQEPFILNFSLGLTCYIIIYTIPGVFIWYGLLQASPMVTFVLSLGALPILSSVIRFMCLKAGTGQANLVYILSMLELALAIIVVSIPGLEQLFFKARSHRNDVPLECKDKELRV